MHDKITVFTPTYNRVHTLKQCYIALCKQTNKNFLWMIVDDGSVDSTKEMVEQWIKEGIINIQYIYQTNKGKQRAVNTAVKSCKTKFFAFLDSDDYYVPNTVSDFLELFQEIENNSSVSGICARRGTKEMTVIGSNNFTQHKFIDNFDQVVRKYGFYGDTCRAYKTDVLKQHLYPEISDKFILESVMLSSMDLKYDLLFVNEIFSISEYLADGYTKNSEKLYRNNPLGYALGVNQLTIANRGIIRRIRAVLMYTVWCKRFKLNEPYKSSKNKELYILLYPISYICFLLRKPNWVFESEKL